MRETMPKSSSARFIQVKVNASSLFWYSLTDAWLLTEQPKAGELLLR